MMDEEPEDDVLFDQAGLLSKQLKPMKKISSGIHAAKGQQRLIKTVCLCAAFFGLGLCIAVPGPTLKDLANSVGRNDEQIGLIFTGRSVGYLAGSFIGGQLFDKLNQYMLMSMALFFTGIATISAPFSSHLYLLIGLISVQGITMGFLDTGGNVVCVNLWGSQSGPYMQAMHFSFGAGAFIAPLLAEPFLTNDSNKNPMNVTMQPVTPRPIVTQKPGNNDNRDDQKKSSVRSTPRGSTKMPDVQPNGGPTNSNKTNNKVTHLLKKRPKRDDKAAKKSGGETKKQTSNGIIPDMDKFQFAFVIIGVLIIVISFLFTALCCCGKRGSHAARNSEIPGQIITKEPAGFRLQVIIMLFIFYFIYVGMEITYGSLCAKFAVDQLNWSKPQAAYLTAVFWGSFALSRFLAIFLARFSPSMILIADLLITFLSMLALVFSQNLSQYVIWIGSSTLGVGMASIFPTGLVWAENYMEITGKATSVFVVGSALGEMVIPFATNFTMAHFKKPMYLMYVLLACSFIAGSLFIFLLRIASSQGGRYQKVSLTHNRVSRNKVDTSLEMEGTSNDVFPDNLSKAGTSGPSKRQKPSFKSGTKAD